MGKLIGGIAAALVAGVAAAPAAAQTAEYNQKLDKSCCSMTLEAGDTARQFMSFTNTGTKSWFAVGAVPVRLGASNPIDRASPFFNPADWLAPNRLTPVDELEVPPGKIGSFTWTLKAPAQPGTYREYYAPVAEGVTWMAPTSAYYLDYKVIAAQPPVLNITAVPPRVRRGDPIIVTAGATDNRGVARVTFTVGSTTVTAPKPIQGTSGYAAVLSSAGLGTGTQNLVVRAFDLGGRESSGVSALEVYKGPAPASGARPRLRPFQPLFATRAGSGRSLGTFNGIGGAVGARRGALLRVLCVRGCARPLKVVRRVPRRGALRITLGRPLPLRRSTRVELQLTARGFVTRYQRYRFEGRPEGTRARQVSAGCLARKKPRRTTACPGG